MAADTLSRPIPHRQASRYLKPWKGSWKKKSPAETPELLDILPVYDEGSTLEEALVDTDKYVPAFDEAPAFYPYDPLAYIWKAPNGVWISSHSHEVKNTCIICLESLSFQDFPKKVTADCEHSYTVCKDCLMSSLKCQMDTNFIDNLRCPQCLHLLGYRAMQMHASKEVFERFDAICTRQHLNALPQWWDCPKAGCGSGVLRDNCDGNPLATCPSCEYRACVKCCVPWHSTMSCKEFQKSLRAKKKRHRTLIKENLKSRRKAHKITEGCPQCGVRIEKNGGCRHVYCTRCKYEFCYHCHRSWTQILSKGHTWGCRFHPETVQYLVAEFSVGLLEIVIDAVDRWADRT